jgi:hypothetical protein
VPLLVEWTDGRKEAILSVLEEETEQRRFLIRRLPHYYLYLTELMNSDLVVPVVVFLNEDNRTAELRLGDEWHCYLQFYYPSCELKQLSAENYRYSDNT